MSRVFMTRRLNMELAQRCEQENKEIVFFKFTKIIYFLG